MQLPSISRLIFPASSAKRKSLIFLILLLLIATPTYASLTKPTVYRPGFVLWGQYIDLFGETGMRNGSIENVSCFSNCTNFSGGGTNFTINISTQPEIPDAVTLAAGSNITLSQSGRTITIASTGGVAGLEELRINDTADRAYVNATFVTFGNSSYVLTNNASYVLTNNGSYVLTNNVSYVQTNNGTYVLTNNLSYYNKADADFVNVTALPLKADGVFLNITALPLKADGVFLNTTALPLKADASFLNATALPLKADGALVNSTNRIDGGFAVQLNNSVGEQGNVSFIYTGTLVRVKVVADTSGTVVINVLNNSDDMTGGHNLSLLNQLSKTDTVLTGWNTTVTPDTVFRFRTFNATTSIARVSISFTIRRT